MHMHQWIGSLLAKVMVWQRSLDNWGNFSWWRHQMETFSALLALCAGNSPVPVNSPGTKVSDAELRCFFDLRRWINDWVNNCEAGDLRRHHGHYDANVMFQNIHRAANRYGISVFCTDFTCKIREYEFGLENTEIELCQFCHLKYCCQNKAYLFWVANQSVFVAFYALEPSNTSLITKTFNLLSSTCSSSMLSCLTSCSCSTGSIH